MILSGKGLFSARVLENRAISPSTHLIVMIRPDGFPEAQPGQFVSIRITGAGAPLLRRPYSICDLTGEALTLLVKIVGVGSAAIAGTRPDEMIDLLGPLGNETFPDPVGEDAVFVAGGAGLAPIVFAIRRWTREGTIGRSVLLHGAECRDELLGDVTGGGPTEFRCATIDGSEGHHGDVVTLCEQLLDAGRIPTDLLYSCGPRGMVKALVERVDGRFAAHYTSLEAIMACGVGACRGCTVPVATESGAVMKAVCSDGTVFRAREIAWDEWKD